jgi:DNA (cytosine-5)-methyltransferase 1
VVTPGVQDLVMRPRLLDLFCCAGGCSVGYHRAGWDVTGVDYAPQPDYPFTFHRADALRYPLGGFDAYAASPPCKVHTALRHTATAATLFEVHQDLVAAIRDRLADTGRPYVIENVPGAPLLDPVTYCGSSFGLKVRRHRLFESNVHLVAPPCDHASQPVVLCVYGTGGPARVDVAVGARTYRGPGRGGRQVVGAAAAEALGIDWTTDQRRLSQAIPPAYTEHIGRQLLAHVGAAA